MKRIGYRPEVWNLGKFGRHVALQHGKQRILIMHAKNKSAAVSLTVFQLERILKAAQSQKG